MKTSRAHSKVSLSGHVRSGKGLGSSFIRSLNTNDPIVNKLGSKPYPGTLYFELAKPVNLLGEYYNRSNSNITFLVTAEFQGIDVVVKWTNRFPQNLQIVSNVNLRETFNLKDNQKYVIRIDSKSLKKNNSRVYFDFFRLAIRLWLMKRC